MNWGVCWRDDTYTFKKLEFQDTLASYSSKWAKIVAHVLTWRDDCVSKDLFGPLPWNLSVRLWKCAHGESSDCQILRSNITQIGLQPWWNYKMVKNSWNHELVWKHNCYMKPEQVKIHQNSFKILTNSITWLKENVQDTYKFSRWTQLLFGLELTLAFTKPV